MTERWDGDMMLVRFNHKFTPRQIEWLFAAILLGWSITLFAFPSMFSAPESAPQFVTLSRMFGQVGVAFSCGAIGLARLSALWINGRSSGTPYVRMFMAFFSCFFWYQISLGLFLSGVPTTSWAVYPTMLVFEMINVLRAAADARIVYDQKRAAHDGTSC